MENSCFLFLTWVETLTRPSQNIWTSYANSIMIRWSMTYPGDMPFKTLEVILRTFELDLPTANQCRNFKEGVARCVTCSSLCIMFWSRCGFWVIAKTAACGVHYRNPTVCASVAQTPWFTLGYKGCTIKVVQRPSWTQLWPAICEAISLGVQLVHNQLL